MAIDSSLVQFYHGSQGEWEILKDGSIFDGAFVDLGTGRVMLNGFPIGWKDGIQGLIGTQGLFGTQGLRGETGFAGTQGNWGTQGRFGT